MKDRLVERRPMFDRAGVAALSDLESAEWRRLYDRLNDTHQDFAAARGHIRGGSYPWPLDPLHTWSRIWEYPFVLQQFLILSDTQHRRTVADIGSGVTFFPFSIARLGFTVICVDHEPTYAVDIAQAAVRVGRARGSVTFALTDGYTLPFETGSLDAIYCVSVIEHVPHRQQFLREIHRVLAKGGTFVYTCDLDLRGDAHIDVHGFREMRETVSELFETAGERTVHPAEILTTRNSPYPLKAGLSSLPRRVVSSVLTPLVKRERRYVSAVHLAVYGGLGTKR